MGSRYEEGNGKCYISGGVASGPLSDTRLGRELSISLVVAVNPVLPSSSTIVVKGIGELAHHFVTKRAHLRHYWQSWTVWKQKPCFSTRSQLDGSWLYRVGARSSCDRVDSGHYPLGGKLGASKVRKQDLRGNEGHGGVQNGTIGFRNGTCGYL